VIKKSKNKRVFRDPLFKKKKKPQASMHMSFIFLSFVQHKILLLKKRQVHYLSRHFFLVKDLIIHILNV